MRPSRLCLARLAMNAMLGGSVIVAYAALLNDLALSEETLLSAAAAGIAFSGIYVLDFCFWTGAAGAG